MATNLVGRKIRCRNNHSPSFDFVINDYGTSFPRARGFGKQKTDGSGSRCQVRTWSNLLDRTLPTMLYFVSQSYLYSVVCYLNMQKDNELFKTYTVHPNHSQFHQPYFAFTGTPV